MLKFFACGLTFLITCNLLFCADVSKPNIVMIVADDLGYSDLGCYGGEAATPHLDRLAANGVRFTQFYNAAKCEPTRAALMTSHRNTHQVGFYGERAESFLPALLQEQGYRTMISGKWHVSRHPLDRGFQRFYGHEEGASNFYTGSGLIQLDRAKAEIPDDYYTTDAFTDYAIRFMEEAKQKDDEQPFFLYLAYTAPHTPLQAPQAGIEKYRGQYSVGWHKIKEKRLKNLRRLGLVAEDIHPTEWPENLPQWDELTDSQKEMEDLRMATFTAMIDRMDQQIGRVLHWLDQNGERENTLIIFFSDNGANPFDRGSERMVQRGILPGGPNSAWSTGTAWAHVSNTPFRLYKRNQHEGGIRAPLIMQGPTLGYQAGSISNLPVHVLDFLPTLYSLARGSKRPPGIEGTDLAPLWKDGVETRDYAMIDSLLDHRYVRKGEWKLVSVDGEPWELYDLSKDPSETMDLAAQHEKVKAGLQKDFEQWWMSFSRKPFEESRGTNAAARMGDKSSGARYIPSPMPSKVANDEAPQQDVDLD